MGFVVYGVIQLVLHFSGWGPMAKWNWEIDGDLWKFVLPFFLALLWWGFADSSGLTKRREMEKEERRKRDRRRKSVEALGMTPQDDRRKGDRRGPL
ncbi:TIGR04438 family Trp-rich protein [Ideonella livida]|nr:TIGR04438 family Trp-rich protein [Ideonella livida]